MRHRHRERPIHASPRRIFASPDALLRHPAPLPADGLGLASRPLRPRTRVPSPCRQGLVDAGEGCVQVGEGSDLFTVSARGDRRLVVAGAAEPAADQPVRTVAAQLDLVLASVAGTDSHGPMDHPNKALAGQALTIL